MRKIFTFRGVSAFLLSLALLLGGLGLCAQAADPAVSRVVSTFYDAGKQGFHWYTEEDCESKVVIGGKTYTGVSALYQGLYAHSVVADDLDPGTVYTYQIGDFEGTFKTDPGRGEAISFIVTGDAQASDANGFAHGAAVQGKAWEMFPDSDFTVTLGDHTNDSDNAQWDMYFDAFKGVHQKGTVVPIAGNHDGLLKWNWFRNMFTLKEPSNFWSNLTGVYYSFDYGDAHFAVLNTNDMLPMTVPQRNWLVNDMSRSDAKWKIVFMHKSPYSAGNDALAPDVLLLRRALLPLFDQLGIDLVLSGHDHQYYRSVPVKGDKPVQGIFVDPVDGPGFLDYPDGEGTVYIMPGAACNKRYAVQEPMLPAIKECAALHEDPGKSVFANISISGDTLTYQAYTFMPGDADATPYDTLTLQKTQFSQPDPNFRPLPTDFVTTFPRHIFNFVTELFSVIVFDYVGAGLLFGLLGGLLG